MTCSGSHTAGGARSWPPDTPPIHTLLTDGRVTECLGRDTDPIGQGEDRGRIGSELLSSWTWMSPLALAPAI